MRESIVHYSNLLPIWQSGTTFSANSLLGDWKLIAQATNGPCSNLFLDSYVKEGIKNQDGSPLRNLHFSFAAIEEFNQPPKQKLVVRLLNIGKSGANQGPYLVDEKEPQFSQWGYRDGDITSDGYFNFSCRSVALRSNQMICALAIVMNSSALNRYDERSKNCAKSGIGVFQVFEKTISK